MAERLAAVLALATLGLSVYVVHLRRELGRAAPGIVEAPGQDVILGDDVRGNTELRFPKDASYVSLTIVLDAAHPEQDGQVEIIDGAGKIVWQSLRRHLLPGDAILLFIPRSVLPDGDYQVRIVPAAGGESVIEENVTIKTTGEPAP